VEVGGWAAGGLRAGRRRRVSFDVFAAAHNANRNESNHQEGCGELFDSGQEFLDRIAISLGGKALVPAAGALLPAWLQDAADWRKRHAALICLAQVRGGGLGSGVMFVGW
jgi:hypothetical protein